MGSTVVYDIEILLNYFCYSDINVKTGEIHTFEIYADYVNDFKAMMKYLRSVKCQIGYNNINFDYPIIHFFFEHEQMLQTLDDERLVTMIYDFVQRHMEKLNNKETLFTAIIPEWKWKISQIDLYRIHHFDNMAKKTSLKDLEIAMNWKNVQDMPYAFNRPITRPQSIEIKDYNINDITATFEFFKKSQIELKLRLDLSNEYNLKLLNANDIKLGAEIFSKIISDAKGISVSELKKMRTNRKLIVLRDCILDYIGFDNWEFNSLLKSIKNTVIKQTKKAFEYHIPYKGFTYDYGTGGIHGCIKPGIYEEEEGYRIQDVDVASFYPNLGIRNKFYPEHLDSSFCDLCEDVFEKRKLIPKTDIRNAAYKLMLNGIYGKSNDVYSFFYDPMYTMKITLNGQLLLTMLCEKLQDLGVQILQVNTDGVTFKHKVELDEKISNVCKWWMNLTKLQLEHAFYSKMIIRDVNN